jgi:glycerophosphoryl diester phosphodiesterase
MIILAHRGFWLSTDEKNSLTAFERAFTAGYGVELDVRDFDGELVISHDPARASCPRFSDVLALYQRHGMPGRLAINIKADGLAPHIAAATQAQSLRRSIFVFDMSVPDMISYVRHEIPTFSRHSEYEPTPAMLDACDGVWIDSFTTPRADETRMAAFQKSGKAVAMVSPELHGKPYREAWRIWRSALPSSTADGAASPIMICTDLPADAERYFGNGASHD